MYLLYVVKRPLEVSAARSAWRNDDNMICEVLPSRVSDIILAGRISGTRVVWSDVVVGLETHCA